MYRRGDAHAEKIQALYISYHSIKAKLIKKMVNYENIFESNDLMEVIKAFNWINKIS
jgi:hypothetical protein